MSNFNELLERISSEVADYASDNEIPDFELDIHISCTDGWASVKFIDSSRDRR